MTSCKLTIKDEVNIKLDGLPVEVRRKLANKFKYEIPHAKYHPAYKLGRWDGNVSLFSIGGTGYISQLPTILSILEAEGVDVGEIEDLRQPLELNFPKVTTDFWGNQCWPPGHRFEGQPIRLREDQVEVVNKYLENPQCLQEIATGFGKCLVGSTLISVIVKGVATTLSFDQLAAYIESTLNCKLENNQEVDVNSLHMFAFTPTGAAQINQFIKKTNLSVIRVTLQNGYAFTASANHIVRVNHADQFVSSLNVGDRIGHRTGSVLVTAIEPAGVEDCFDIAINSPHLYYDANGVIHHNTITTATLAKVCESIGRTLTIVPNKSLVEQTEEDFVNCGLDVGVYYGDRKDTNKTHTIATWQSLNILDKKSKNSQEEILTLAEYLDGVKTVMVDECFSGDTPVLTPNGYVPIADLKVGDRVINFCEATKTYKEDTIVKVHKNLTHSSNEEMLELAFDNSVTIRVTANHKFLTDRGWVRADCLTEDMNIIDINTYAKD